jgi:gamma-glutamyltranspeptidase/glutathione hydrolase
MHLLSPLAALSLCLSLHSTLAAPLSSRGLPALNAASQGRPNEHSTSGHEAAVATEVDVCSNIGADLIKAGGSAADAIIGASLCVGSIDAFHSGIGGGGFILTRAKIGHQNHKVEVIDMRESAPAASNETMYSSNSNPNASTIGGLSIGIPGELRGFEYLHSKHGRLPWKQVFAPAVRLNREGFKVTSQLSVAISQYSSSFLCSQEYWKEVYCANGTAAGLGDHIKRTRYADTLELIGEKGASAFYDGPVANRTIEAIQSTGGIMTRKDLKEYNVIIRKPLHFAYQGTKRVWSSGAPSSGAVVLSALKTMATYSDKEVEQAGVNLTTHRLIEATKVRPSIEERSEQPRSHCPLIAACLW